MPPAPQPLVRKREKIDYRLTGSRNLASSWRRRAADNIAAILTARGIEPQDRPATSQEQEKLIRYTGFGASELANGMFRRPEDEAFRKGWEEFGSSLEAAVGDAEYASLARCTQYAHFTPEFIVRAIWSGLCRMGFAGGRILEPGIGAGIFGAMMPEAISGVSYLTGVELDPVTSRIVRLLQPRAKIINQDFARVDLPGHFDLATGNPPFSDRSVRSDPVFRAHGFRLHDYFIVKAIDRLKPGGLAAFATSSGTMDKSDGRDHIAGMANLGCAIRLPEGRFRADAATEVVVDPPSHDCSWQPLRSACFTTEVAPMMSKRRNIRSPIFDVAPSFCFPPVESCNGVSPTQAAKSLPFLKVEASGARAIKAVAVIAPTPGTVAKRRASASSRARRTISVPRCFI